jgi:hypothetical protein
MNNPEMVKLAAKVENRILLIRGHRVMLSGDLAVLYEVDTKYLTRAVRRNSTRFPADFMFPLSQEEHRALRCQIGTLNAGRGQHRKYPPLAFTEQGVSMLSSVLRSPRAVAVNIEIMRAFVRLRQLLNTNKDLARRLDELERKYDSQFRVVFEAIRQLMIPPVPKRRQIGFRAPDRE